MTLLGWFIQVQTIKYIPQGNTIEYPLQIFLRFFFRQVGRMFESDILTYVIKASENYSEAGNLKL